MKLFQRPLTIMALVASLIFAGAASAAEPEEPLAPAVDLALKGDAKCTRCHDETEAYPILKIGKTRHGTVADQRTPTCTSCHGESEKHLHGDPKAKGRAAPDVIFRKGTYAPSDAETRNKQCLACHQTDANRTHWAGSTHQARDVACVSCHQIHTSHDAVRDKQTQPEVCFTCHKEQRAMINKPSHHPIPEGKLSCSDCHNPHGTTGTKLLVKDTVTDTCYQCHPEKRGPFIWNHQPVTDDCANCHNPHGTTADYMLKTRPPFLCLSCHDPSSHLGNIPGIASRVDTSKNASGVSLGATTPRDNLNTNTAVGKTQGLSCLNCHTDIHGSNNPANSTNAMRFWR